jgi:hypothetical protein
LRDEIAKIYNGDPLLYKEKIRDIPNHITKLDFRWGTPELENNEGEIFLYLVDTINALAESPKFKDEMEPRKIKLNQIKNIRGDSPEDVLVIYEMPDLEYGEFLQNILYNYYEPEVIDIKVVKRGRTHYLEINRSIDAIIYDLMNQYFDEDLTKMKAESKKKVSDTDLNEIMEKKFTEPVTEAQIKKVLKKLIADTSS